MIGFMQHVGRMPTPWPSWVAVLFLINLGAVAFLPRVEAWERLRERARDSLAHNGGVDADAFARLSAQMRYADGDYADPQTYQRLRQAMRSATRHAIGRIGCLLVGDDYGRPTDLPWGIAFPEGLPPTDVPVHPTQIYEAGLLVIVGWALVRWRRRGVSDARVLGGYLILAGATRFGIEFIRVNERVLFGLSVAHVVSLLVAAGGVGLIMRSMNRAALPHRQSR